MHSGLLGLGFRHIFWGSPFNSLQGVSGAPSPAETWGGDEAYQHLAATHGKVHSAPLGLQESQWPLSPCPLCLHLPLPLTWVRTTPISSSHRPITLSRATFYPVTPLTNLLGLQPRMKPQTLAPPPLHHGAPSELPGGGSSPAMQAAQVPGPKCQAASRIPAFGLPGPWASGASLLPDTPLQTWHRAQHSAWRHPRP